MIVPIHGLKYHKFEMPNLNVCYIDIDEEENEEISRDYNVKSLPLQIFIKLDGNKIVEIKKILGYDWINFLLTYNSINEVLEAEKENKSEYEDRIRDGRIIAINVVLGQFEDMVYIRKTTPQRRIKSMLETE